MSEFYKWLADELVANNGFPINGVAKRALISKIRADIASSDATLEAIKLEPCIRLKLSRAGLSLDDINNLLDLLSSYERLLSIVDKD